MTDLTMHLPEGKQMTVTGSGTVYQLNVAQADRETRAVTSSGTFGPYAEPRDYRLVSNTNDQMAYALEDKLDFESNKMQTVGLTSPKISGAATKTPITLTASGAIDISLSDVFIVEGDSNFAMTLAAPASSENGRTITIMQKDAITGFGDYLGVTATGLFMTGALDGASGTATAKNELQFNAAAGGAVELLILNGKYIVKFAQQVTFAPA